MYKTFTKLFLLCVIFFLTTSIMSGAFLIKGGLSMGKFTWDVDVEGTINFKPGFVVGLGYEYSSGLLGIEADVMYSQKGYKIEDSGTFLGMNYKITETTTFSYISIPVIAKLIAGTEQRNFYFGIGPEFNVFVSGNYELEVECAGQTDSDSGEIENEDVASTEISGVFTMGVNINKIIFEARYSHGLTTLLPDDYSGDHKMTSNTIQLLAGLKF